MEFKLAFEKIKEFFESNSDKLQKIKDRVVSNTNSDKKDVYLEEIFVINGIGVDFVNGCEVKDKLYMDFVEGGNDQVYGKDGEKNAIEHFMPSKRIWLDAHIDLHELKYVTYHEFVERYHMENYDMEYDEAHEIANKEEKKVRDLEVKKAFNLSKFIPKNS